jgi:putative Mn2+ efflux pump MntP
MNFIEIILIAVSLAMDAAAVSLGAAAAGYAGDRRSTFRLFFHFGLFQFLMPVLGWLLGMGLVAFISRFDRWVAFGLLVFIGGKMIRSGLNPGRPARSDNPSRGWRLVLLSFATSIDALAIGVSLAMLSVNIWLPSVLIGLVTGTMSFLAIKIGRKLGAVIGYRMEIAGGLILLAIGIRILLSNPPG